MQSLVWLFVLGGLTLTALSIPMILRRVKPNSWYGFRTRQTLANEQVWYDVNAHAGKRLLVSGILITTAAILLPFIPGISADLYAWLVLAVVVVTLGIGLASSFRYLNQRAQNL
jgi:uncharacterized membrane protein